MYEEDDNEDDNDDNDDTGVFPSRLGPESGPLALPKLWELLPGLHNLQHLE